MDHDVKEYLVKKRYCEGCIYYGFLSPNTRYMGRCCDYTLRTGKLRQGTTANCQVRRTK